MQFTTVFVAIVAAATYVVAAPSSVGATPGPASSNSTLTPDAQPFSINIGQNNADDVAWIHGESKCTAVIIGAVGSNFCSRPFNLRVGTGFTVEGCGGGLWINQNGQFWGSCGDFTESSQECGITTRWHCN